MHTALLDAKAARILPWIVAIAFFIQALDATILNTALPTILFAAAAHDPAGLSTTKSAALGLHAPKRAAHYR
jgi:hypothetical protein